MCPWGISHEHDTSRSAGGPADHIQPDENERQLVARLRRSEQTAFRRVYERERGCVYGFVLRLSGDANVAADLFQNIWLKLARHAHRLQPETNLRAWLLTVARREFVSYRRAQLADFSRLLAFSTQVHEPACETAPRPAREIQAALAGLRDADREVLLIAAQGLATDQVAKALGISNAACRQRLHRARARFGEALELGPAPTRGWRRRIGT